MKKLATMLAALMIAATCTMTAFAAEGYVGSVELKPAPTVDTSTTVTVNGKDIAVDDLSDSGLKLVVTPISDKDDAPAEEISEVLQSAYDDLKSTEITFSSDEDSEDFTKAKDDAESRGKTLVASNLFDLSILDDENTVVGIDGITATIAVDNADEVVLMMHKADDTWEVVPFTNNGDGTITFTLSSLSPIALFVEADAAADTVVGGTTSGTDTSSNTSSTGTAATGTTATGTTSTGKVTSPSTGASSNSGIALVSATILAAGAVVCVKKSKKSH
jgi:LPXTG-motif cell wall-anchored protein